MNELTPEQLELWNLLDVEHPERSGSQTPAQAQSFAIESFKRACGFDGIPIPSDEVIQRKLYLR